MVDMMRSDERPAIVASRMAHGKAEIRRGVCRKKRLIPGFDLPSGVRQGSHELIGIDPKTILGIVKRQRARIPAEAQPRKRHAVP